MLHGITTIGLCLFLALTSVTLAVARGAPGPVTAMVICTGEGVQRVAVDPDGRPASAPHVCPDCLLALHATAPRDPVPAPQDAFAVVLRRFDHAGHATAAARPAMQARAPPRQV